MARSSGRNPVALIIVMVIVGLATGCFGGQGNVFSLEVRQCFDDPDVDADEVSEVVIVDCDSPHDNEVFAAFDIAGSVYPGVDDVLDAARRGCEDRFATFVGSNLDVSEFGVTFLAPTAQSWDNSDDREVICYLFDAGGVKLGGSMRSTRS